MAEFKKQEIVSQEEFPEDKRMDLTLRPKVLADFIGQERLKDNLKIFIEAARQRKESLDHTLFHGSHGLGKTTLSYIIAQERGVDIKITSGPALEKVGDLAAILTSLEDKSILFIDEIHRLNRAIEEVLYPAMEEYAIDLVVGQGPSAKILRLNLPHFTLIGATTRPSLVSPPLRDRFGAVYQLNFYQVEEIKKIIVRSANILKMKISPEAAQEIAQSSRFTPRVANRLLKRVRDYAQVQGKKEIDRESARQALEMLEIDQSGLNQIDRKILKVLIEKFNGGPVGIKTLAVATGEDIASLEEIYEPYLIQLGFLNRTSRGRIATELSYQHLNFKSKLC
jgi:holliday junction DNA helicase RuvB